MTTRRPYRDPKPADAAVSELRRVAGTQLDPQAVEAFVEAFPRPGDLPICLVEGVGARDEGLGVRGEGVGARARDREPGTGDQASSTVIKCR
jgi:hypothetical protein